MQEHTVEPADSGRPTVSGIADIEQRAQWVTAVARGGAARHSNRLFSAPMAASISNNRSPRLQVRVPGHLSSASRSCLFREATQRKTVGTAVRSAGTKPHHTEIHVHALRVADRRSPTDPIAADDPQCPVTPFATARGGTSPNLNQHAETKDA